jgi:hypothetical protein
MPIEGANAFACAEIPKLNSFVPTAAGKQLTIPTYGDGGNNVRVIL